MYVINGEQFATKKAITERCRYLKRSVGLKYSEGSSEYNFLGDLILQGHPEPQRKLAKHVSHFQVARDVKATCFYLYYSDGSSDDFSYILCIRGLGRSKDQKRALVDRLRIRTAMRLALMPWVTECRQGVSRCALCGVTQSKLNMHHNGGATFENLAEFFLLVSTNIPSKFDEDQYLAPGRCTFRTVDRDFERDWIKFHNQHAELIALCPDCHKAAHAAQKHGPNPGQT